MSRETERVVITQHFTNLWQQAYPQVPVAWPNHEFTTPANGPFAVFNLVDRGTTRESVGRVYVKRHRGTLQVDLYFPQNRGVREANLMAEMLERVYDTLDLLTSDGEVIYFRTPGARPIAGNEARASNLDDNWARLVVECPYDRQERVAR